MRKQIEINQKRKWLYKKNVEPTIFTGEDAIEEALSDGWEPRPIGSIAPVDTIEAVVIKPTVKAKETKSKVKEDIIIKESDDEDEEKASPKEEKTIKK